MKHFFTTLTFETGHKTSLL